MTEVASVYGGALYALAKDERVDERILQELTVLQESFQSEPDFLKLLSSPNLAKAERCQVLDQSFRGKLHPYVLNFLKILTEKGYVRHFTGCCEAYTLQYNEDHGILPVTAVTAVPLTEAQAEKLKQKLGNLTGKQITLRSRIDPAVLGGIRLDYDGQRLDDTVSHRMDALRELLRKTVI